MKLLVSAIVLSVLVTPSAWAGDLVRYDPADALVPNRVVSFQTSIDTSTPPPNSVVWDAPHAAMTQNQRDAMNEIRSLLDDLLSRGVPPRYWLVQNARPREMTASEKTALDAPVVAEQQRQAAFLAEITGNNFCEAELSELETRVDQWVAARQAEMDGATTALQVKTVVRDQVIPGIGVAVKKLARCLRARAAGGL